MGGVRSLGKRTVGERERERRTARRSRKVRRKKEERKRKEQAWSAERGCGKVDGMAVKNNIVVFELRRKERKERGSKQKEKKAVCRLPRSIELEFFDRVPNNNGKEIWTLPSHAFPIQTRSVRFRNDDSKAIQGREGQQHELHRVGARADLPTVYIKVDEEGSRSDGFEGGHRDIVVATASGGAK